MKRSIGTIEIWELPGHDDVSGNLYDVSAYPNGNGLYYLPDAYSDGAFAFVMSTSVFIWIGNKNSLNFHRFPEDEPAPASEEKETVSVNTFLKALALTQNVTSSAVLQTVLGEK